MLHRSTIEPGTFSLLKELMAIDTLKEFSLVGGTALALRYGHRSSIDIDLFCSEIFDIENTENQLKYLYKNDYVNESGHQKIGIFCYIKNIKVDLIHYPFKPISTLGLTRIISTLFFTANY